MPARRAASAAVSFVADVAVDGAPAAAGGDDALRQRLVASQQQCRKLEQRLAEKAELADLDFLGIKGRTPGGTRWRSRAHTYNLRPREGATGGVVEAEIFTAEVISNM